MGALAQRLKPVLMPALLALLLALLPGRAWLPGDWRLVEGLTAFTPQWLALALALGVRALWRGHRLRALVFVLLATPDLVSALRPEAGRPDAGRPDAGRLAAPGTDFTLYAANLGEDPAALGVALETLQATAPDVIWLSEVPATRPAALEEAFDVMAAAYPYGMAWAPAPGRELRFLSRFPLRAREEFNPERARGRPGMRLVLDVQGQLLTVYALHTHPPTQAWSLKARNEALSWVGARVAASDGPVLVLGDLNTSAFSPFFRGWIRDSGLRCPSPWTCATGSWPAPWRPLVTPIDHVLAKGALQVHSLRRGPATGSDHYPLQAELTLEAPQP